VQHSKQESSNRRHQRISALLPSQSCNAAADNEGAVHAQKLFVTGATPGRLAHASAHL
jgi:hypothetical protein